MCWRPRFWDHFIFQNGGDNGYGLDSGYVRIKDSTDRWSGEQKMQGFSDNLIKLQFPSFVKLDQDLFNMGTAW